jgi:hypothetical protein
MNIRFFAVILVAALMWVAGCGAGGPVQGTRTDCLPVEQACAMQAARDVVVKMGFRVDKFDVESGVLTTRPLSGAQYFELWRSDNADGYDSAEANLHSIQRVVQMTFTQSDGKVCMLCDARVRKLSLPEREVTGTSDAYRMFTRSSTSLMATRFNTAQARGMAWVDMGSDGALAAKILARVDGALAERGGQTR